MKIQELQQFISNLTSLFLYADHEATSLDTSITRRMNKMIIGLNTNVIKVKVIYLSYIFIQGVTSYGFVTTIRGRDKNQRISIGSIVSVLI